MRFPKWPRWVWRCYAATFAAVATFVVCSLLPMWSVQYWGVGYACIELRPNGTLWEMLTFRKSGLEPDDWFVLYEWKRPAITTAVFVHIATIVGALLGGIRWRKQKQGPTEPERG